MPSTCLVCLSIHECPPMCVHISAETLKGKFRHLPHALLVLAYPIIFVRIQCQHVAQDVVARKHLERAAVCMLNFAVLAPVCGPYNGRLSSEHLKCGMISVQNSKLKPRQRLAKNRANPRRYSFQAASFRRSVENNNKRKTCERG
jgi:hypothetical protein